MPDFMLFHAPPERDADTHARELWLADDVDAIEGAKHWDAAGRAAIARELADADARLRTPPHEADEALVLSTETEPGVDYEVRADSVLVEVDGYGLDPARELALLRETLAVLDRVAFRCRLLVYSAELDRVIDATRHGAELESHVAAKHRAAGAGRRLQRWAFILFAAGAAIGVAATLWYAARG